MKYLILIFTFVASSATSARVDDAPEEYGPKEKLEWISAFCKWRMPNYSDLSGYISGQMDQKLCHAIGRYSAIRMADDPNPNKNPKYNQAEFTIIYDDHKGFRESCRLIPQKKSYDDITAKDFSDAYLGNEQHFEDFIKKLDANIKLTCLKF